MQNRSRVNRMLFLNVAFLLESSAPMIDPEQAAEQCPDSFLIRSKF